MALAEEEELGPEICVYLGGPSEKKVKNAASLPFISTIYWLICFFETLNDSDYFASSLNSFYPAYFVIQFNLRNISKLII